MARKQASKKGYISDDNLIREYEKKRENLTRIKNQMKEDKKEGFESPILRQRCDEITQELNSLYQELQKRGIQLK